MNNSISNQIDQEILKVLLPIETAGEPISPRRVAEAVDKQIDPESLSPTLKTFLTIESVTQRTRKILSNRHDPIKKAEMYSQGETDNLFGDELQPFYPVKRVSENKSEPFYIRREDLTETDVELICKRMERAGLALKKHSGALRAWYKSVKAA